MSTYVAAYDIADNRRRRRLARALHGWGQRVQESVFEVSISPECMEEFQLEIGLLLGARDQFDLYPIDTREPRRRKRWQKPLVYRPAVILG